MLWGRLYHPKNRERFYPVYVYVNSLLLADSRDHIVQVGQFVSDCIQTIPLVVELAHLLVSKF